MAVDYISPPKMLIVYDMNPLCTLESKTYPRSQTATMNDHNLNRLVEGVELFTPNDLIYNSTSRIWLKVLELLNDSFWKKSNFTKTNHSAPSVNCQVSSEKMKLILLHFYGFIMIIHGEDTFDSSYFRNVHNLYESRTIHIFRKNYFLPYSHGKDLHMHDFNSESFMDQPNESYQHISSHFMPVTATATGGIQPPNLRGTLTLTLHSLENTDGNDLVFPSDTSTLYKAGSLSSVISKVYQTTATNKISLNYFGRAFMENIQPLSSSSSSLPSLSLEGLIYLYRVLVGYKTVENEEEEEDEEGCDGTDDRALALDESKEQMQLFDEVMSWTHFEDEYSDQQEEEEDEDDEEEDNTPSRDYKASSLTKPWFRRRLIPRTTNSKLKQNQSPLLDDDYKVSTRLIIYVYSEAATKTINYQTI
eukprot:gene10288-21467_t